MSQFDFPRINFNGLIEVNVGTGNNDDYSSYIFPPESPYAGQLLRLADSVNVQPNTFGMSDADWLAWVQKKANFLDTGNNNAPQQVIPAEWNYYGDMGLTMMDVTVSGVDYPPGTAGPEIVSPMVGATVSYNNRPDETGRTTGLICDVNPEAVPSSQMIASNFMVAKDGKAMLSGRPSKASTRWINFNRNTAIGASGGASASFFHTIPLEDLAGQPILETLKTDCVDQANLAGVMIRYNLYRSMQKINGFNTGDAALEAIEALYKDGKLNAAYIEITGTITPWYKNEMQTVTPGRQLNPSGTVPVSSGGNGTAFRLGPVIAKVNTAQKLLSLDVSNAFPEKYALTTDPKPLEIGNNPKYNLGTLTLKLRTLVNGVMTPYKDVGPIPNTSAVYQASGGMVDFSIADWSTADLAALDTGILEIQTSGRAADSPNNEPAIPAGTVMLETDYFIASDQSTIFGEQSLSDTPSSTFNFNGTDIPCSFRLFKKGKEVTDGSVELTIQEFDTTPNQDSSGPMHNILSYKPGDPLKLRTPSPGNKMYYAGLPGTLLNNFGQVDVMTMPIITMRILPNEDYAAYYVDPNIAEPVGNSNLTFDVIYEKVLRNYYLLYPAMSQHVPLNNESYWKDPIMASALLQRIKKSAWPNVEYMPRTRDLSDSRRELLAAWCRKILQTSNS